MKGMQRVNLVPVTKKRGDDVDRTSGEWESAYEISALSNLQGKFSPAFYKERGGDNSANIGGGLPIFIEKFFKGEILQRIGGKEGDEIWKGK